MGGVWSRVVACLLLATLILMTAGVARADEDARAIYEKGTALFALHRFADAAAAYERAFVLRPDAAILYNAAQAHRLAGDKSRALELYQSLLHLYPNASFNHREVSDHIDQLKQAVANDARIASSPPTTPLKTPADSSKPVSAAPSAISTPAPAPVVAPVATEVVVAPIDTAPRPVTKRKWFLPVVITGAVLVIAGVTVGVIVGTSKTVGPGSSLGVYPGN